MPGPFLNEREYRGLRALASVLGFLDDARRTHRISVRVHKHYMACAQKLPSGSLAMGICGNFPKSQVRPKNTIILGMGTLKRVPLMLGNPTPM